MVEVDWNMWVLCKAVLMFESVEDEILVSRTFLHLAAYYGVHGGSSF